MFLKIAFTGALLAVFGSLLIKFIDGAYGKPNVAVQVVILTLTLSGVVAVFVGGMLHIWY